MVYPPCYFFRDHYLDRRSIKTSEWKGSCSLEYLEMFFSKSFQILLPVAQKRPQKSIMGSSRVDLADADLKISVVIRG